MTARPAAGLGLQVRERLLVQADRRIEGPDPRGRRGRLGLPVRQRREAYGEGGRGAEGGQERRADRAKAAAALRAFLASAPDHVAFAEERLATTAVDKAGLARARALVADLDADAFATRDAATDALVALGDPAAEAVRAALAGPASDERRMTLPEPRAAGRKSGRAAGIRISPCRQGAPPQPGYRS